MVLISDVTLSHSALICAVMSATMAEMTACAAAALSGGPLPSCCLLIHTWYSTCRRKNVHKGAIAGAGCHCDWSSATKTAAVCGGGLPGSSCAHREQSHCKAGAEAGQSMNICCSVSTGISASSRSALGLRLLLVLLLLVAAGGGGGGGTSQQAGCLHSGSCCLSAWEAR